MKRIIPFVVILAIAGGAAYLHPQWFHPPQNTNVLRLSGNIEAHESLVSFKVTGRVVALPVDEGASLKAGDLVARLDNDDYHQQVVEDESAIAVRQRQLALGMAGSRPQDIEAAKLAVFDAQADLDQKKKDYERYQTLFDKDEIPGQTRDLAETAVVRAQMACDRAQQVYNELLEGTRKEELAVERSTVHEADQSLQMSRLRLRHTVLRAPFNGIVLVRQAELGEVVSPGTPIVTLGDLDHLWVRVYVPETDLGKVHWGQTVRVHTDSFPDKTYDGRVSFISDEAEFTPKSVQTEKERVTLVYRVKVDVDNPRNELKPGMPADVDIKLR